MTIEQLIEEAEEITHEREINIIVSFIEKMVELFPKIREVQPTIEKVGFGMGAWYFYGHAVGVYTDEEEDGEGGRLDADVFAEYVLNSDGYCFYAHKNEECEQFIKLANSFVDTDSLNASTLIDYISDDGVVFEREKEPKSMFGHPSLSSLLTSRLFKRIKERNIKVKVIEL